MPPCQCNSPEMNRASSACGILKTAPHAIRHKTNIMGRSSVAHAVVPASTGFQRLAGSRLASRTVISLGNMMTGTVYGPEGNAVADAAVELRQQGRALFKTQTDRSGYYRVAIPSTETCEVFITNGRFSAYQFNFPAAEAVEHQVDWTLADTLSVDPLFLPERGDGNHSTAQFPSGTVAAKVLTDENGAFTFQNMKPGMYQVRCPTMEGYEWYGGGRIFSLRSEEGRSNANPLADIDFEVAPFKRGSWTRYNYLNGLPSNHIRKLAVDPEGRLWIASMGGVSIFDGKRIHDADHGRRID